MTLDSIYVKTVYKAMYLREPGISKHNTKKEAEIFIDTCLKWGIGIVSCEIVDKPK